MSTDNKVTLCMITKNEEDNIACCIGSVKHLIDEIIVVDTGSQDGTIEQALQAGAIVLEVDWQRNFAEARNHGLEQATGDWILVLDADEILEYIDAEEFNKLLADPNVEGYYINIESCIGNGEEKIYDKVVRLFKNKPQYRFTGAIHEQVVGSIAKNNQGKGLAGTDFTIIHRGYLHKTIQAKNKHSRNMEVIHQALLENPYDPFLHYSLGIEYIQQGEVSLGNEQLAEALRNLKGGEGYFQSVVVNLASGLLQTGQIAQAEELIHKGLVAFPKDSQLLMLKGMTSLYNKDYKNAVILLQQSLIEDQENGLVSSIHALCGDIYAFLDCYDHAEKEYFIALQQVPQCLYPLLQLIGVKQKGKGQLTWQQISQFTSLEVSKDLQAKLISMGELPIVLVVALLAVIQQASDNKTDMTIVCSDYLQVLRLYQPADELAKMATDYLKYSAEMILLYAKSISSGDDVIGMSVREKVKSIAKQNLDLIIKTLCSTWIPCITLNKIVS